MEGDAAVIARLRAAGCVWAEDEAAVLAESAGTPAELDAMVARRVAGEPLEHVVGWAGFCGLRIFADPGVFVPRRRSEFLVSVAVGHVWERAFPGAPVIVDLCCGTGALGLAVAAGLARGSEAAVAGPAREAGPGEAGPGEAGPAGEAGHGVAIGGASGGLPAACLHAADLDPAAVACARRNVGPAGGHVYAGDLFAALPGSLRGRAGVLVCNAPYVPTSEIALMPAEAREHEALTALDGGADGLAVLRRVTADAGNWLAPGGVLLVETSERQAQAMAAEMTAAGLAARVHADEEYGATVITGTKTTGH